VGGEPAAMIAVLVSDADLRCSKQQLCQKAQKVPGLMHWFSGLPCVTGSTLPAHVAAESDVVRTWSVPIVAKRSGIYQP
jgi:hypothetical protein